MMKTPEEIVAAEFERFNPTTLSQDVFDTADMIEFAQLAVYADRAQRCQHDDVDADGAEADGSQIYLCHACGERWNGGSE